MIISNSGDVLQLYGIRYIIGDEVVATSSSEYEGLVGKIVEIRDYDDKISGDKTMLPDICCAFNKPMLDVNKEKVRKKVSKKLGREIDFEDINFDYVPLSCNVIVPLSVCKGREYSQTIFVVTEDWVKEYEHGTSTKTFNSLNEAQMYLEVLLKKEKECGMLSNLGDEGYVMEMSETSFEYYKDGYEANWHYSLCIEEQELDCSDNTMENLLEQGLRRQIRTDILMCVAQWDGVDKLSDDEYKMIEKCTELPEKSYEQWKCDEYFWDAYRESVEIIANRLTNEVLGRSTYEE